MFTIVKIIALTGILALLGAPAHSEQEEWRYVVQLYGWLPTIDIESEDGTSSKITADDLIDNLDMGFMTSFGVAKGKWRFATDVLYMDLSNDDGAQISPLLELKELALEAWIVAPNVGYEIYASDRQSVNLVVGARYLWLDNTLTLKTTPPGNLPGSQMKVGDSASKWDAIAGVAGRYRLGEKWLFNYSLNAGAGQSDFTGQARGAFSYEISRVDAVLGWRYMTWHLGESVERLTISGPFVGALFTF